MTSAVGWLDLVAVAGLRPEHVAPYRRVHAARELPRDILERMRDLGFVRGIAGDGRRPRRGCQCLR